MAQTKERLSPAQMVKFLEGVDLPASRQDLLRHVREKARAVLDVIEAMPDQEYRTMADVMKGIGQVE